MATSKFLRTFRTVAGVPITTATIWLVPQANTYPTGALALTAHSTRDGQYYRDNVPDGEYKIYIDPAGGSSPTLYEEEIWIGEARITTISDHFDSADSYKLKGSGIKLDNSTIETSSETLRVKDAGITAAKLATDAVETAKIKDLNVTNAKIANATILPGKLGAQIKSLTLLTDTPDYIGQLGTLGGRLYQAFSTSGVFIKWNEVKSGNFPFRNDITGSSVGAGLIDAYTVLKRFVWDLHIVGNPVAGKTYMFGEIRRNAAGVWLIRFYNSDIVLLAQFSATSNPENGSAITIHKLTEYAGSGISGYVAVKWDEITSGTTYSNLFVGWELDDRIFNGGTGLCLAYLNKVQTDLNTAAIVLKADVESDGKLVGAYIDPIQWKHPRGDAEYIAPANYGSGSIGQYELLTNTVTFDKIKVNMYGGADTTAEIRIYTSDTFQTLFANMTLLETVNITAGGFNTVFNNLMEITLLQKHRVLSGKYIYVMAGKTAGTAIKGGRWTTAYGSSPERHSFFFSTVDPPFSGVGWSQSSIPSYGSTPLLLEQTISGYSDLDLRIDTLDTDKQDVFVPRLVIPANIYVAIDRELNLWYDAMAIVHGEDIRIVVTGSLGKTKKRSYRYTPTSTGTAVMTAKVYDKNGLVLETKSFTVNAVAKNNGSGTKQVLCIGDSLMSNGVIPTEIDALVTADGGFILKLLGTRGTSPILHEGRGGWRFEDFSGAGRSFFEFTVSGVTVEPDIASTVYSNNGSEFEVEEKYLSGGSGTIICSRSTGTNNPLASGTLTKVSGNGDATIAYSAWAATSGNPFWDGTKLNFKQYMSDNSNFGGTDTIDFALIQLGINDIFSGVVTQGDVDTVIQNAKDLLAGILNATYGYPACKIILALSPIGGDTQDGFAANYGAFDVSQYERNMRLLWESMITNFDVGIYSAQVRLSINGLMVDRHYGYALTAENISARVTTQYDAHTNGVHPAASGYYQCADAFYSSIRGWL